MKGNKWIGAFFQFHFYLKILQFVRFLDKQINLFKILKFDLYNFISFFLSKKTLGAHFIISTKKTLKITLYKYSSFKSLTTNGKRSTSPRKRLQCKFHFFKLQLKILNLLFLSTDLDLWKSKYFNDEKGVFCSVIRTVRNCVRLELGTHSLINWCGVKRKHEIWLCRYSNSKKCRSWQNFFTIEQKIK